MVKLVLLLAMTLCFAHLAPAQSADSSLFIKVGQANLKKSNLAIPPFLFESAPPFSAQNIKLGKEMYDVLSNDLNVSGFFEIMRPEAFLENTAKMGLLPASEEAGGFSFDSWKQIGSEFLIRAGYRVSNGQITVNAYLFFVPTQKRVLGKTYKGNVADTRKVAHTIANDVVKELTGMKGFFNTKLVATKTTVGQIKEVFVMDWDGANSKQISNHKSIAVSPTWSNDGSKIVYSAFALHKNEKRRNLDMFLYELATGKRLLISYRRGINSGASFLPDDSALLLTLSDADGAKGSPDVYQMSLDGSDLKKLTNGPRTAMNVEPAMSPDKKKVAFSSDRSGVPMIYIMNADGSGIERVTFAGWYNSNPRWSPDGKRIVFAGYDKEQSIKGGHFDIFIMNADGTNMSRLTSAKKTNGKMANNESPSFSPDGRHVMFVSDRTGTNQVFIVSADGQEERRITFDKAEYSKPQWSPYLD